MQLRFEWLALYVAVAALYLLLAWREWSGERPGSERAPVWHGVVLGLTLVLHGRYFCMACSKPASSFGFAHALSATLLAHRLYRMCRDDVLAIARHVLASAAPAAVAALLPALFPGAIVGRSSGAPLFQVHLLLAILAYSLLTIAAIHALLMATMGSEAAGGSGRLAFVIDRLPPLLAMEGVLFRLDHGGIHFAHGDAR